MSKYERELEYYQKASFGTDDAEYLGWSSVPNDPDYIDDAPDPTPQDFSTTDELVEKLCINCLNIVFPSIIEEYAKTQRHIKYVGNPLITPLAKLK